MRVAVASSLALGLFAASAAGAQPPAKGPEAWRSCCNLAPWPEPGPMKSPGSHGGSLLFRGYGSISVGSAARHRRALGGRIPAAYAELRNPLPATPENARRGAAVYEAQCASCHGEAGLGDGPGSRSLMPPPAHLGWIARLPASRWDSFMYWSTVEGGAPFGTAMPAYKGRLTDDEIWAVIGYIEARMPARAAAAAAR